MTFVVEIALVCVAAHALALGFARLAWSRAKAPARSRSWSVRRDWKGSLLS